MVQKNSPLANVSDRSFHVFNAVVSSAALSFLAYILIFREAGPSGLDLSFLPAVNASLNATAALLLAAGWIAIRRRELRLHKRLVVAAFAASALFLVCYLVYHWSHGDTRYQGEGLLRVFYFTILISHILLSVVVVPGALAAFFFAYKREFDKHKKVTKILMPVWLYVSVTGVVIYFMLRGA
jgi:putative membrane protein